MELYKSTESSRVFSWMEEGPDQGSAVLFIGSFTLVSYHLLVPSVAPDCSTTGQSLLGLALPSQHIWVAFVALATKEVTWEIVRLKISCVYSCIESDCQGLLSSWKASPILFMSLWQGDCASSVNGTVYLRQQAEGHRSTLLDCVQKNSSYNEFWMRNYIHGVKPAIVWVGAVFHFFLHCQ